MSTIYAHNTKEKELKKTKKREKNQADRYPKYQKRYINFPPIVIATNQSDH